MTETVLHCHLKTQSGRYRRFPARGKQRETTSYNSPGKSFSMMSEQNETMVPNSRQPLGEEEV